MISGTTTVGFMYNGDGVRVSKTVNGVSTAYVQDLAAPLPVVLVETTGGQDTLYLYGLDLITQVRPDGSRRWYHTDALGSVRALTDDAGQPVATYDYDAFGTVRSQTDGLGNPFTFAGEQVDREIELVYLRARYYDPAVGRFASRDPVPGTVHDPMSLEPYIYARCNPVLYVDPTGKIVVQAVCLGASLIGLAKDVQRVTDPRPISQQEAIKAAIKGGTLIIGTAFGIPCLSLFAGFISEHIFPEVVHAPETTLPETTKEPSLPSPSFPPSWGK